MRNEALFLLHVVHEDVLEGDFLGVLCVSFVAVARCTIKSDFRGDLYGPLAVEVADDFSSLVRIHALSVAARGETILLEVADETTLQLLVLLRVFEEHVKDSLENLCSHVAVV